MANRETEIRREWVRNRLLSEAWALAFPARGVADFIELVGEWFRRNNISFGLFAAWATGNQRDPIGSRAAVLTIDSPNRTVIVGWARITRRDLERLARDGRAIGVRVIGWLRIADDVDAELAARALESVRVVGVSRLPSSVRARLVRRAA